MSYSKKNKPAEQSAVIPQEVITKPDTTNQDDIEDAGLSNLTELPSIDTLSEQAELPPAKEDGTPPDTQTTAETRIDKPVTSPIAKPSPARARTVDEKSVVKALKITNLTNRVLSNALFILEPNGSDKDSITEVYEARRNNLLKSPIVMNFARLQWISIEEIEV